MKKRIAAAMAAIILLLCGCQATPEKGVVNSKNDGAFEAALEDKASSTLPPETEQPRRRRPPSPPLPPRPRSSTRTASTASRAEAASNST